ncbi:small, acid-soluble spore protein L [Rossellomorea sp. SC111]|nr:small, acid-soluble spore protein L [Rossellomorea sp. SC111]MCR8846877.1 small, acid-soluble spore protein L [Rossellomorea sp. SC111]
MTKGNNKNKGKSAKSVNPQGISQDAEFATEPKSELENAAKKTNKK